MVISIFPFPHPSPALIPPTGKKQTSNASKKKSRKNSSYPTLKLSLSLFPPPSLSQHPPDHFPRRTLRQRCHELDPAREPLGLVHAGGDPCFDLTCQSGFVGPGRHSSSVSDGSGPTRAGASGDDISTDDEGARLLGSVSAGNSNHGGVEDGGMGEQECFQLSGGDLVGGDFDEVL